MVAQLNYPSAVVDTERRLGTFMMHATGHLHYQMYVKKVVRSPMEWIGNTTINLLMERLTINAATWVVSSVLLRHHSVDLRAGERKLKGMCA